MDHKISFTLYILPNKLKSFCKTENKRNECQHSLARLLMPSDLKSLHLRIWCGLSN